MEGSKSALTSKTVWSGIVTTIISLLVAFGVIGEGVVDSDEIVTHGEAIITAIAGLVAIYGRFTATKTIGSTTESTESK